MHINDKTNYKFNIKPKYFGNESNYTEAFPKRIKEILSTNNDVKIFCVFDWDTIYGDEAKLKNMRFLRNNSKRKSQTELLRYALVCRVLSIGSYYILWMIQNY